MSEHRQWEGGRGSRYPRWLAWLAVIAVIAITVLVARDPQQASQPLAVEGDRQPAPERSPPQPGPGVVPLDLRLPDAAPAPSFCPPEAPVRIIDGTIYARTYPLIPDARPETCFPDIRRAQEAGHRMPIPPPGVIEVSGVYLVPPADQALQQACVRAAREVHHVVPCPGRLPKGGRVGLCAATCTTGGGYVMTLRGFQIPGRWCRRCTSEIVISAAPEGGTPAAAALTRCSPGRGRRLAPTVFRCLPDPDPSGFQPHAGHTLRRGTFAGITYAVSAEGFGLDGRRLAAAIFDSLVFVGEPGGLSG